MFKTAVLLTLSLFLEAAFASPVTDFVKVYGDLGVSNYELSHEKNIKALLEFSKKPRVKSSLRSLEKSLKQCGKKKECELMSLEILRLKKRVKIGKLLNKKNISNLKQLKLNKKLYKKAYEHAVFEWTNDPKFSFSKIKKYEQNEIIKIRKKLSLLDKHKKYKLVKSPGKIKKYLEDVNLKVLENIKSTFTLKPVPKIKIKLNKNPDSQHIPGYYDLNSGTFYFTMPRDGLPLGELDWLFLHEALPGHHMQIVLDKDSLARKLFSRSYVYLDFLEGWAAYVETYGKELGLYKNVEAETKRLEWDLLRSTRVLVDIGIHRKEWSAKRAKAEWKALAPEVLSLADREIKRMINWPAQVIAYEYGKMKLIEAREKHLKTGGTLLSFHTHLLNNGQMPTFLL